MALSQPAPTRPSFCRPDLGVTHQTAPVSKLHTAACFISLAVTETSASLCILLWQFWAKSSCPSHLIPPCFNLPTWCLGTKYYRLSVICFLVFLSYCSVDTASLVAQTGPRTHYVADDDFGFPIPLPRPLEDWDHRHLPPYPVHAVFGIQPEDTCVPGKLLPTELPSPPFPLSALPVQAAVL